MSTLGSLVILLPFETKIINTHIFNVWALSCCERVKIMLEDQVYTYCKGHTNKALRYVSTDLLFLTALLSVMLDFRLLL